MSNALATLLKTYFRVPTKAGYHPSDPGKPPSDGQVAETIERLSDAQRRVIDEPAMAELLDGMNQAYKKVDRFDRPATKGDKSALVKAAMERDPAARGTALTNWAIVIGLQQRRGTPYHHNSFSFNAVYWVRDALKFLRGRKYTLTREQALAIVDADRSHDPKDEDKFSFTVIDVALDAIAANRDAWTFSDDDRATFKKVADALGKYPHAEKTRARIAMLRELLSAEPAVALWDGEPWAKAIQDSIAEMEADAKKKWSQLLAFGGTCSMSKPSRDWMKEAAAATKEVKDFELQTTAWLRGFVTQPRREEPEGPVGRSDEAYKTWQIERGKYVSNTTNVIGLIWLCAARWSPGFAPLLADVAEAVAKFPQKAREPSAPIGAAAIKVLGSCDDDAALAQLSKLEIRVRWPKLKSVVKKQLGETIKRRGLDRADVEESMVPDFGLRDGVAVLSFDGFSAEVTLGRGDKPSLTWKLDDGKTVRTVPAALKARSPEAAGQAKQLVSDVEKMRAAQRTRLDLLMRRQKSWSFTGWRSRYLDHGLVGSLARRLIWVVDDTPVIWRDGTLIDVSGKARAFEDEVEVRLWHPAQRPVEEVVAWRKATEAWQVVQPFKQAYREVYLLTDAEQRTRTYSNRFAAHVVRSMTLLSISQVRQWKTGLYGGQSSPSFELTDHGLRAEWWLEPAGDEHTPFGTPLYLASDQVRFQCVSEEAVKRYGHSALADPLPLEKVPPLALSEVMRDVDLFVALSSVGNDPEWQDGGPGGRHRDYWQRYSFGDLTATAQTRSDVLQTLVPRLKIASRCTLTSKFLVVRGNLRTYKVHLGSGNILMEPNDQYLCIVPGRSPGDDGAGVRGVFLPFEGDRTLSVILSKAFLLAADDKITDPTITRQIGQKR